ncbi:DUF6973 domain-containing protein [Marmoricola sp. RAF53]|uniref:DUF6973 domain-containing protein n=1 Tax=Marmoricola sp. RAF53 TaxID=3233059 RepID=UPI003F9A5E82
MKPDLRRRWDAARARVHAGAHAGRGAPRLYRAARAAGASRFDAARMLAWSGVVLLVVSPRAAGVAGRQNAVRHFVWQAMVTARYGAEVARRVADAQESGTPDATDSAVDVRNNAVARSYGSAHADELGSLSTFALLRHLLAAALSRWEAGELAAEHPRAPGRVSPRACRARRPGSRPDRSSPGPATPPDAPGPPATPRR